MAQAPGHDLDRLRAKQVAYGIDGIRPHVRHRPGPEAMLGPVVGLGDMLREGGGEQPGAAQPAGADQADRLQRRGLEVQPISDQQLRAGRLGGGGDGAAVVLAGGHRLFQQDMQPGLQGGDGELAVLPVRQGHVEGVELAAFDRRMISVVMVGVGDAVALAQGLRLLLVAGDDGGHLGVAGVGDAGHERRLADPPGADDGIAHLAALNFDCHCWPPALLRATARRGGRGSPDGGTAAAPRIASRVASWRPARAASRRWLCGRRRHRACQAPGS